MTLAPTESEQHDAWVDTTISGKFRVEVLIGEGAMGRVYRAEHLALSRKVAVKVLHDHLCGDQQIARRFRREARAAGRLSHPNSLQIIDFGETEEGVLFIVMEFLQGQTLRELMDAESPLDADRVGALLLQTLRALSEAHHAGVIHRDLKPENIMVLRGRTGSERLKVCDFGIAKIMEQESRGTAITQDGYVCGTPEYMSPEQAKGETVDPRADLYSVGVMLYQMLCAQLPFQAQTALGIITKHLVEEPVPPSRHQPDWDISPGLEEIALKSMAKDPVDRYQSAEEMIVAVEAVLSGAQLPRRSETDTDISAIPGLNPARSWLIPTLIALGGASALATLLMTSPWGSSPPTSPLMAAEAPRLGGDGEGVRPSRAQDNAAQDDAAGPTGSPSPDTSLRALPASPPSPGPANEEIPSEEIPNEENTEAQAPRPRRTPRHGRRAASAPSPTMPTAAPRPGPGPGALAEGRRLMLSGDLPRAIERLREAASALPRNASVQKELGRAHMRQGNVPAGVRAYRRYLQLSPNAADRPIVERILARHAG